MPVPHGTEAAKIRGETGKKHPRPRPRAGVQVNAPVYRRQPFVRDLHQIARREWPVRQSTPRRSRWQRSVSRACETYGSKRGPSLQPNRVNEQEQTEILHRFGTLSLKMAEGSGYEEHPAVSSEIPRQEKLPSNAPESQDDKKNEHRFEDKMVNMIVHQAGILPKL